MTEAEIRNNIKYNEDLITEYTAQINEYDEQLEELEALRKKYTKLQNDFEERQAKRKKNLNSSSSKNVSSRIYTRYLSGMSSLLTGSSYTNADNGLTTAKEKINKQINKILAKIDTLEDKIAYRKKRKKYWENMLKQYLASLEEE